ncbi:MAG: NusG domain II-containing protein [Ruminococcus sp.]|nr:NusG domain II-containing protein [Ruminococcus sp.]
MNKKSSEKKRKYFAFPDVFVLSFVVIVALVCVCMSFGIGTDDDLTAVVYVDGNEYTRITLNSVDEPYEINVHGELETSIRISSEGVGFVSSDCPDKLCVNTGTLTKAGESAVCLPARVSLKLVSTSSSVPDAVAG